jgi:hypothetical protein
MSQSTFPYRLHQVLAAVSNKTDQDSRVISWTPSGTTFRIHDLDAFKTQILPQYFPKQKKYSSFRRQLQYYGFTTLGWNQFGHPLFIRNQEEQLVNIKHKKGQSTKAKLSKMECKKKTLVGTTSLCSNIANHLRGAQSRSSHLCNVKHSQASKQLILDVSQDRAALRKTQLDLDLFVLALQQRRGYMSCAKQQTHLSQPRRTDYNTTLIGARTDSDFLQLARMQLGLQYF